MRRCCGRGRAASSEQPALALFVVWRLANARRCRTSEPVACGLAAGMRRRRTCRRSSPSIKPLGRVVGGVGRSNLDRLRVRGRCAQCANPGAGSAALPPPCSCYGTVARRRHCTVAALEAASSHQGRNPQGGLCSRWGCEFPPRARSPPCVVCSLVGGAPCDLQGWTSWTLVHTSSSAPCFARGRRGGGPGAVLCPPCIIARVGLESPHCRGGGRGTPRLVAVPHGTAPPATDVWLGPARCQATLTW